MNSVTTFVGCAMFVLTLVPTLLLSTVHAQTLTMPAGWIATAEPSGPFEKDSTLMQANYSRHEWRVSVSSGRLEITDDGQPRGHEEAVFPPHFHRTKYIIGRAMTARAGGNWLIGFDGGEFGGGLLWASPDGKRTKLLVGGN